jgi:hypothetical protein
MARHLTIALFGAWILWLQHYTLDLGAAKTPTSYFSRVGSWTMGTADTKEECDRLSQTTLEEHDKSEFVPRGWKKEIHESSILLTLLEVDQAYVIVKEFQRFPAGTDPRPRYKGYRE